MRDRDVALRVEQFDLIAGVLKLLDAVTIRCPKKTTFSRVLHAVDDDQLERLLLGWQAQVLGPTQDRIVIMDGKKVRHAGVAIVNAVDSQGRFLGSVMTQPGSNEIPAARQLLRHEDLHGQLVLADALPTQEDTVRQILYEQGGDYLLTVKRRPVDRGENFGQPVRPTGLFPLAPRRQPARCDGNITGVGWKSAAWCVEP